MGRRWLLFGVCLLAFSTAMWGQLPVVPGTDKPEHPQHTHRHDRRVNFGIKGVPPDGTIYSTTVCSATQPSLTTTIYSTSTHTITINMLTAWELR